MAIYVLVHGATAGGWIWQSIPARLRAAGHDAFTPTLTGLGDRRHLFSPDITMETHILDVLNVLFFEDLHQVILVGHSYGGAVITGVAEKAAERLSHLVYLDAFVPQDGEAVKELYDPPVVHTLTEHYLNGGKSLPVNGAEDFLPAFSPEKRSCKGPAPDLHILHRQSGDGHPRPGHHPVRRAGKSGGMALS